MIKLTLPVILFLSISTPGFSKTFPGYYLDKNGDSIHCDFQFKDWTVTPEALTVTVNNNILNLQPADISGFGVYGYGDYISREISYHPGNYSSLNAPDIFSDKITTKHSFLKRVVPGKYTLYELAETAHSYFFVSENSSDLTELVYRVKKTGMTIEEDNAYKKTIFSFFSKENLAADFSTDITKGSYTSRSIGSLFRKLNEKVTGVNYKSSKRGITQMDVFVGGIDNKFPTSIDGFYSAPTNKFDGSSGITGGVGVIYFTPGNFRRFAVGATLGYNQYSTEFSKEDSIVDFTSIYNNRTTKYKENFTLGNKVLMVDLFGMYFINPLDKVKVYLKAGFNTNIAIDKENDIDIYYTSATTGVRNGNIPISATANGRRRIDTRKLYYNIHGGLGLNAGSHKLEFTYYTPGVLNTPYLFKIKMMGVYYYYTIIK
jgi:hypothetical protein